MPAVTSVALTGDQDVDGLLSRVKWAVSNLTYSFPASASYYGSRYGDGEPQVGFKALNTTQRAVVKTVLGMYAAVANITFTEVTESATVHADLRYAQSGDPDTAWAYYPATAATGGDSWYNSTSGWYDNPVRGNYAFHTFIHETGHALGLKHGQEDPAMSAAHDSMEYTLMTYRSYKGQDLDAGGYTNGIWSYAQTPMMYDIAALQAMYGANYSANSGDTTYSWNPTTGVLSLNGIAQTAPGFNRIFMTVWDGGGNDTFDFSAYTTGVVSSLQPGAWTTTSQDQLAYLGDAHYAEGNIANALLFQGDARSLIENIAGGAGNDVLSGNDAINVLEGNAGVDQLAGLGGNDVLRGGAGNDFLNGGDGLDVAQFGAARSAHVVVHTGATFLVSSGGETDTLTDVERLQFTDALIRLAAPPSVDPNADGKTDLLFWNPVSHTLGTMQMNGVGYTAARDYSFGAGWSLEEARSDLNADGGTDLVMWNGQTHSVGLMQMNGVNSVAARDYQFASGWELASARMDLNGDGKADLVLWNQGVGSLGLMQMDGVNYTSGRDYSFSAGWRLIDADADINGDGKNDLVLWNDTTRQLELLQMDGLSSTAARDYQFGSGWQLVDAEADLNGDGKTDLVLWNSTTNSIGLMQMNGVDVAATRDYALRTGWGIASTRADLNGDGMNDLVLWNGGAHSMQLMQMNGVNSSATHDYSFAAGWQVEETRGDYNGDGKTDLAMWNSQTLSLGLMQMDGVMTAAARDYLFGPGWVASDARSDINADGKSDIALFNHGTDALGLMQMNGMTLAAAHDYAFGANWNMLDFG